MTDSSRDIEQENEALRAENSALRGAVSLLHKIANLVRESNELEPTCYAVLTGVTAGVGLGMNRAMIFLANGIDRTLVGAGAVGPADQEEANRVWKAIEAEAPDLQTLYTAGLHQHKNPCRLDRIVRSLRLPVEGGSPVSRALKLAELVFGEGEDDVGGLLHLPTCMAAPMRGRDSLRGVLYADNSFTGRIPDPVVRQVFALVADHAGRAIENAQRFERMAKEARTDALTGLSHHGAMWEALEEAIARVGQTGGDLLVAMVDLDDFKRVNDTLGHLTGDALLAGVAERLRAELRSDAGVFRYGGEEFAVIAEGAREDAMATVGERIRETVAKQPFPVGEGRSVPITCSVGIAAFSRSHPNGRSLISAADAALLTAKARGKNRVEIAAGEAASVGRSA